MKLWEKILMGIGILALIALGILLAFAAKVAR